MQGMLWTKDHDEMMGRIKVKMMGRIKVSNIFLPDAHINTNPHYHAAVRTEAQQFRLGLGPIRSGKLTRPLCLDPVQTDGAAIRSGPMPGLDQTGPFGALFAA